MTIKTLVSAGIVVMLATTAFGQSVDPARVEVFRSVLKDNNCTLTEADADNILPRFDFTKDETRAIVGALMAADEVRLDGGVLNLVDGSCDSGDPVADLLAKPDVQQFITVMAENNCTISESYAATVFPAQGMDKAQVGAVVRAMIQANMATFSDGVLQVDSAYCSPAALQNTATPALDRSGMFGMTRVRELVDLMAQNGCTLNMEVADAYLLDAGYEHSFATAIAGKMLSDGYATMQDAQNLHLEAPYCLSAGAIPEAVDPATQPDTPPAPTGADGNTLEAAFIAVAAQSHCALSITEAQGRLENAGLRMDQAYRIVDDMVASGRATLSQSGAVVTLDPARCADGGVQAPVGEPVTANAAPQPPTVPVAPAVASDDPRAGVLAMLAANGCTVTQANAADMIAQAGLDYNTSMQILTQMMGAGEATSPDGGQTLHVGAPLCVAAAAEPKTPREVFINLIKQNNCSVTAAEFGNLLPVDGLDAPTAFGMISELEAEGVISLPASRDVVTLSAEMCR